MSLYPRDWDSVGLKLFESGDRWWSRFVQIWLHQVTDSDCIIVDDIVDTAGTLCEVCRIITWIIVRYHLLVFRKYLVRAFEARSTNETGKA